MLVSSVFIISTCALFYELLLSTISSYLLGSSVLHFSLVIGLFMFFLGVGAYVSKFITEQLLERFVAVEILLGFVGGFSGLVLTAAFSLTEYYYLVLLLLIGAISVLVGLEIPLVTRLVREYQELKDALAHILAFDYLGALVASIVFPLLALPYLGTVKTSFLIGIFNVLVAVVNCLEFRRILPSARKMLAASCCTLALLGGGLAYSSAATGFLEHFLYQDEIIFSTQTRYQKLVLTKFEDDFRLFINGDLQFSSIDEYRYHESLVHVPLSLVPRPEEVLVLGGGDGLAVREILKDARVGRVTLVDIDAEMTRLGREHPLFAKLNDHSFSSAKVSIVNEDAWKFLEKGTGVYSVIIIDLPDPNDTSLGKLYSAEFYGLVKRHLAGDGVLVTQSTSPYFAREAFWCINHTLREVFPTVVPYNAYVPSFGLWGFNLASSRALDLARVHLTVPTKFLTPESLPRLFIFDKDTGEVPTALNHLDSQELISVYERSADNWN